MNFATPTPFLVEASTLTRGISTTCFVSKLWPSSDIYWRCSWAHTLSVFIFCHVSLKWQATLRPAAPSSCQRDCCMLWESYQRHKCANTKFWRSKQVVHIPTTMILRVDGSFCTILLDLKFSQHRLWDRSYGMKPFKSSESNTTFRTDEERF
jgi:hypothetical protein